ncbi:MAG: patatin-like phospholipase family protein [Deltaproteobacteria bacterium]|nr:patatin-like phospholipase family protein [Deltaproteobacteria bacterium]
MLAGKRILVVGGADATALAAALQAHPGADAARWVPVADAHALLDELRARYVNLIVLDVHDADALAARAADALHALDALDDAPDVEDRYAFDRIVVLVPERADPRVDDLVLRLGARGVRTIQRGADPDALVALAGRLLGERKKGRRALCASGGGITGLYFHLGALHCLDHCLGGRGVNDFDLYFGISAGAVVTAPLAVGYSVAEVMAAIAGAPGGRLPPMSLRLFRLGNVDAPSFVRRAALAVRTTAAGVWSALSGRRADDDSLLFDYANLVAAPFRADRFERMIREALAVPGGTNDFRELTRPLFVGATDQDTRTHVLFGDEHHADVPISRAVQASLSINPAFSATRIGERFYEDGAVTRTSNFVEAIRRGATLVVVVDPFVPFVAQAPGFADRRGMLYNIDQDVRTISYTRYETTRRWVLRQHPEVSAYTFVPQNRVRRLMSVSPMDHRPYLEVWRGAYLSMFNRLRAIEHRFAGDLAAHGLGFDLARAEAVAERLDRVIRPTLADFFPDGRVDIPRRPLCREPGA